MTKRGANLQIKRVYDLSEITDRTPVRIDQLWPRGSRKANGALTLWLKDIVPSSELRKWSEHDLAHSVSLVAAIAPNSPTTR